MKTPDPYQIEGAEFLAARKRAGLFDDMGVGKTLQAVIAASIVDPSPTIEVVCNASAVSVWENEFDEEWMLFDKPKIDIVSYDGNVKRMKDKKYREQRPTILIGDEVHYAKNEDAQRSRALEIAVNRAEYAWGLTGTPAMNNNAEMYNLLRLFAPGALKGIGTKYQFWTRYSYVRDTEWGPKPTGYKNVPELRDRLKGHVLRRTEEEARLNLPPVRWGDIALRGDSVPISDAEAARMRQAVATIEVGGVPKEVDSTTSTRRLLEIAKARPLAHYLKDELSSTKPDHKLVIFGWFNDALDIIEDELQEFGVCRISGSTSKAARGAIVNDFQTGSDRVFVGQILAAGASITLTASNNLVFLGLDWVPGNNAQAARRVRRRGQRRPVLIRTATLLGTLDGVVQEVVARKTKDMLSVWEKEETNEPCDLITY